MVIPVQSVTISPPGGPRPSPVLASLFPPGVAAAEMWGAPESSLLYPEELKCVSHCAQRRILDFAGGRLCARHALADLAIRNFPLLSAAGGQPIWPAGVAGSISHTGDYCAAVVGARSRFLGLGLDAEAVAAVDAEVWPLVCTTAELAFLSGLEPARRSAAAALIFAAKEAFYKCQFPLAQEWIGFEEVEIEVADGGSDCGDFQIRELRPLRVLAQADGELIGRFCFAGSLVIVGMTLHARAEPAS